MAYFPGNGIVNRCEWENSFFPGLIFQGTDLETGELGAGRRKGIPAKCYMEYVRKKRGKQLVDRCWSGNLTPVMIPEGKMLFMQNAMLFSGPRRVGRFFFIVTSLEALTNLSVPRGFESRGRLFRVGGRRAFARLEEEEEPYLSGRWSLIPFAGGGGGPTFPRTVSDCIRPQERHLQGRRRGAGVRDPRPATLIFMGTHK